MLGVSDCFVTLVYKNVSCVTFSWWADCKISNEQIVKQSFIGSKWHSKVIRHVLFSFEQIQVSDCFVTLVTKGVSCVTFSLWADYKISNEQIVKQSFIGRKWHSKVISHVLFSFEQILRTHRFQMNKEQTTLLIVVSLFDSYLILWYLFVYCSSLYCYVQSLWSRFLSVLLGVCLYHFLPPMLLHWWMLWI